VCREAYSQLRDAKAEIVGEQALLERSRARLQHDFQAWYAAMAASIGSSSGGGNTSSGTVQAAGAAAVGGQQLLQGAAAAAAETETAVCWAELVAAGRAGCRRLVNRSGSAGPSWRQHSGLTRHLQRVRHRLLSKELASLAVPGSSALSPNPSSSLRQRQIRSRRSRRLQLLPPQPICIGGWRRRFLLLRGRF
jgi:hypothetical protein